MLAPGSAGRVNPAADPQRTRTVRPTHALSSGVGIGVRAVRSAELRIGRMYAFPTNPGPWYRHAVPARVMAHAPRNRVLVLFPDGGPASPTRGALPRAALAWLDGDAFVSTWEEWPELAAETRADLTALVSSAVAVIGGGTAPTLAAPRATIDATRWWSRPIGLLLRPPALPPRSHVQGSDR